MKSSEIRYLRKGFSIIEALVSAVVLSGSVMVLCAISTKSLASVRDQLLYQQAWDVAQSQMSVISYLGVDEVRRMSLVKGQSNENGVDFDWNLEISEGNLADLYKVDMNVSWFVKGKAKSITLSTMLNGQGESL